jgi:hypothetical protein
MRRNLVGAAVLLVGLAGCVGPPSAPMPVPSPSSTPVFASDEEALAAAEVAYGEYVAVASQIFADGGADADRLRATATGEQLEADLAGFEEVARLGQHSTGATAFDQFVLQQYTPDSPRETVVVYVCDDVTGVDVLDQEGNSLVSPSRPDLTTYEVSFDLAEVGSALLVSRKVTWSIGC